MTPHRVRELIDAYGADIGRWPAAERAAASALVARDPDLAAYLDEGARLDSLLSAASDITVPAGLAPSIMADARSGYAPSGSRSRETAFPFAKLRAFFGQLWPDQPLWQPAMGLAASLAIGVWVGTLGIVPMTDMTTQTEIASVLANDSQGLSILYGDSADLQEWAYDG